MKNLILNLASRSNTQISVGLMWSFSAVLVKELATTSQLDIFLIASTRSLIGICFLVPLVLIHWSADQKAAMKPNAEKTQRHAGTPLLVVGIKILGAAALATNTFLLCWSFQHTDALTPIFMHYSGLILVAPASVIVLQYVPSRREWLSCMIAVLGLLALVSHGLSFSGVTVVAVSLGIGLSQLIGQLCIGWLSKNDTRVERETGRKQSHGSQCFIICEILTVAVGALISVTSTSSLSHIDARSCFELLLLGSLTWGLPNFLALLAVRTKELVSLSLLWLGDPIGVAIWPVLWGQDPMPAPVSWFGAAFVMVALIIQRSGQPQVDKA